jgi:hypothetical protein
VYIMYLVVLYSVIGLQLENVAVLLAAPSYLESHPSHVLHY